MTNRSLLLVATSLLAASCAPAITQPQTDGPPPPATQTPVATATAEPAPTSIATTAEPAPKMCTKMGCMDGLTIVLDQLMPLKAGKYLVEVEAGDKKGKCEIVVPFPPCGTPASRCEGTLPLFAAEDGCGGPVDKMTFSPIRIGEAPTEVMVNVKRNGVTVLGAVKKPTYKTTQPNGPECPPTCKQAEVTVGAGLSMGIK